MELTVLFLIMKSRKLFFSQLDSILKLEETERKNISGNAIRKIQEKYNPGVIYEKKEQLLEKIVNDKIRIPSVFPFIRNAPGTRRYYF